MHVKGIGKASLFLVALVMGLGGFAAAQLQTAPPVSPPAGQEFVPGEILVKFHAYVPAGTIDAIHQAFGNEMTYESPSGGFQRVRIAAGRSERAMVDAYRSIPLVEYAQLNSICHATSVPKDMDYGYQRHFPLINMPSAWDTATGSGVVAAILDTGIAYEDYAVPFSSNPCRLTLPHRPVSDQAGDQVSQGDEQDH